MNQQRRVRLLLAGAVCAATVGCQDAAREDEAAERSFFGLDRTAAPDGTDRPTPTPTHEPVLTGSGTASYRSQTGYTFQITYTVQVTGLATTRTATEPPGYTQVTVPVSGSGTIVNTTSGHDAPSEEAPWLRVMGIYPKSAAVCLHADSDTDAPYGGNRLNAAPAVITLSTRYCGVYFVEGSAATRTLPADQGMDLVFRPNGDRSYPDGSGAVAPGQLVFNRVPEKQAARVGFSLTDGPAHWVLVGPREGCTNGFDPNGYGILTEGPPDLPNCVS